MLQKKIKKGLALFLVGTLILPGALGNLSTSVEAADTVIFSTDFENDSTSSIIDTTKAIKITKVFDPISTWDSTDEITINAPYTGKIFEGAKLSCDILLPKDASYNGIIKIQGVARLGDNWTWTEGASIPELLSSDFVQEGNLLRATVEIPFGNNIETIENLSAITFKLAGYQCDYNGDIYIDNVQLVNGSNNTSTENVLKAWTFDSTDEGFTYNTGWDYNYSGSANTFIAADQGMLKIAVDYSKDDAQSWSQMAVTSWDSNGMNLTGANKITLDFFYEGDKLTTGGFTLKAYGFSGAISKDITVDTVNAVSMYGNIKKAAVEFTFTDLANDANAVNDMAIAIIGNNTNYFGNIWIDNLKILSIKDSSANDIYKNATVKAVTGPAIHINQDNITTFDSTSASDNSLLSTNITMVDKDADSATKQIYSYLESIGKSSSAIMGQQNNTHHKAGSADLSNSDTYDVTGSYAGIIGIDTLSLTGNEYSATRYNNELGKVSGASLGLVTAPETAAGNVQAAAALTNYNIKQGAIITLSAHMPNFSIVKTSDKYDNIHSYSAYDFAGYSPNTLTGDVMNQILPGGQYNQIYNAYLDMIADYAEQVNGAILFRPFHENTGSWFWWGAAFCDAATYKNVYKYTVEYLRDTKSIHNLIYVYGPGSEAANITEYGERYPGDDYVDMVGFDMYHSDPSVDDSWFSSFMNELNVVQTFATEHHKLLAVTETGVASSTPDQGDSQTALHKRGNKQLEWYQKVHTAVAASNASYFLVWANFGETSGFYTPYVKSVNPDGSLFGHEMLDKFIEFYNDPSTIFAIDQKEALEALQNLSVTVNATTNQPTGYITSPISGSRVLTATELTARASRVSLGDSVTFVLYGKTKKELDAKVNSDGITYSAMLDAKTLETLGAYVGKIELVINGVSVDIINATFNIQAPVEDPNQIDNFENYYGVDALLTKKWATNKASGSTIAISLTKEVGKFNSGEYGMKFTYNETKDGWAGATISKTVDWSDRNALQFFTIPDGKNQKVVIQLTASGKVYESYLNLYDGYRNSTTPILVTIPFSEFCQRDTAGNPKGGLVNDCVSVTSFGLWVNAIDGTPAVVDGKVTGSIYYDDITAIKTSKTIPSFEAVGATSPGGSNGGTSGGTTDTSNSDIKTDNEKKDNKPEVVTNLTTIITTQDSSDNEKLNSLIKDLILVTDKLQYISVSVTGVIDKNETMKVKVNSLNGLNAGSKVYVYAYNERSNKLECLNKTTYTMDKDGFITLKIESEAQYVFFTQKLSGESVLSRAAQTKVDKNKVVKKGKKEKLSVAIKNEYQKYAKVSYRTDSSSIISITKNGTITGKKKGKAVIIVTVKIGKVKKEFTTNITVK